MKLKHIISSAILLTGAISFGQKMNMDTLSTWSDKSLTPTSFHKNVYNDVWGYVQDGNEYGIIGSSHGTHIIDLADPVNPDEVVFIPGNQPPSQYPSIVHRDYHTYKNYLYMVSDEGTTNLKIADLSGLPTTAPVVYNSSALIFNSHNVFVDTTGGKLYSCGGFNQFSVYDLTNPILPTLIYENTAPDAATWSKDMGYVHDVYVRNDTAYMNAGANGLFVADFSTDPPTFLGSLTTYPHQGYNHSGWLSPLKDIYILADENHGKDLKVLDVSDLTDINTITTFNNAIDPTKSIPHNVIIKDNLVYVSYYFDGIYVFDIEDPSNPYIKGYFDTSTEPNLGNFRGCWGVYPYLPSGIVLASDMQNGLFIFSGDISLSAEKVEKQNWSVYPTLIQNKLHIKNMSFSNGKASVSITDISGKTILTQNIEASKSVINFEDITNGVYFVSIIENGTKQTIKVIKE